MSHSNGSLWLFNTTAMGVSSICIPCKSCLTLSIHTVNKLLPYPVINLCQAVSAHIHSCHCSFTFRHSHADQQSGLIERSIWYKTRSSDNLTRAVLSTTQSAWSQRLSQRRHSLPCRFCRTGSLEDMGCGHLGQWQNTNTHCMKTGRDSWRTQICLTPDNLQL